MPESSPNKDRIDSFEERVLERFNHEKMKDWSLERLHEARYLFELEFTGFKNSFPPEKSGMQGEFRAFVYDDPNEERHALTVDERLRLRHIKRTALGELNRAEGKRKEKNREHRLKVYNTVVDASNSVSKIIRSFLP